MFSLSRIRGGTLAFVPAAIVLSLVAFAVSDAHARTVEFALLAVAIAAALLAGGSLVIRRRRESVRRQDQTQHLDEESVALSPREFDAVARANNDDMLLKAVQAILAGLAVWGLLSAVAIDRTNNFVVFALILSAAAALLFGDQMFRRFFRVRVPAFPKTKAANVLAAEAAGRAIPGAFARAEESLASGELGVRFVRARSRSSGSDAKRKPGGPRGKPRGHMGDKSVARPSSRDAFASSAIPPQCSRQARRACFGSARAA